jgi:hypothetical protein
MSSFSFGQIAQLVRSLEAAGYTPEHLTKLGQLGVGGHASILAFLEERAKIGVAGFDPATFIGKGWRFAGVGTPAKIRSTADVQKVTLLSALRSGEKVITGEETLRRLISWITLGAEDFHFIWTHQEVIPEGWKRVGAVFFDADLLLSPDGYRYTLFLYWDGEGWVWAVVWLDVGRGSGRPSAVLA